VTARRDAPRREAVHISIHPADSRHAVADAGGADVLHTCSQPASAESMALHQATFAISINLCYVLLQMVTAVTMQTPL